MEAEDRGFLSAMLGGRTRKDTSYFAYQCSLSPELPGGVEELAHLPAHIAEPRGCAKDDGVSSCQLIHRADRDVGHGFLGLDRPHFFQHLRGERLRYSAQDHFGIWNRARPFGYGLCQTCEHARTLNSKRSTLSSPIPPDRVGTMLPLSVGCADHRAISSAGWVLYLLVLHRVVTLYPHSLQEGTSMSTSAIRLTATPSVGLPEHRPDSGGNDLSAGAPDLGKSESSQAGSTAHGVGILRPPGKM